MVPFHSLFFIAPDADKSLLSFANFCPQFLEFVVKRQNGDMDPLAVAMSRLEDTRANFTSLRVTPILFEEKFWCDLIVWGFSVQDLFKWRVAHKVLAILAKLSWNRTSCERLRGISDEVDWTYTTNYDCLGVSFGNMCSETSVNCRKEQFQAQKSVYTISSQSEEVQDISGCWPAFLFRLHRFHLGKVNMYCHVKPDWCLLHLSLVRPVYK